MLKLKFTPTNEKFLNFSHDYISQEFENVCINIFLNRQKKIFNVVKSILNKQYSKEINIISYYIEKYAQN